MNKNHTTSGSLFSSSRTSLTILFFLSFVYFLENFDRSLISVSPIPYIDYGSYEYSVLAGPAFTIMYTFGGVVFALMSYAEETLGVTKDSNMESMTKFNILSLTTLIFSVSFACTAFALYFWQQVLIRITMGLAQSVITPFSTSIISDYFPPEMRGSAFGIFNLGTYISFSLSLSLGIWIYIEYGWQAGYILFGMIGVACAMVMPILSCTQRTVAAGSSRHTSAEEPIILTQAPRSESTQSQSLSQGLVSTHSLMHSFEERDLTPSMEGDPGDRSSIREYILAAPETTSYWDALQCRVCGMAKLAYEICFVRWYHSPGIYLLCLATGVRLGAGYIWVAYTGAFYSDLFETEDDSSCSFSYSADYASVLPSNVCDSDYPYCVEGECSALTSFPWHNKGMDSLHLVEYMAWVPIVGSAFGNVLGGFVSDHFIGKQQQQKQATEAAGTEDTEYDEKDSVHGGLLAGAAAVIPEAPSASQSQSKSPSRRHVDQSVRMLIAGVSNLLPIPLIIYSLLAEFPYCFLIMIASGMMGEMYMGQALAAITDLNVTPLHYITPSVALFMFVTTLIGGNTPLLIPLVASLVGYSGDVNIDFQAASVYAGSDTGAVTVDFVVRHRDARQLQLSLIYVLAFCYGLAGVLYLISYYQMRRHERAYR